MPSWIPNALIVVCTAIAVVWIATRGAERDLWVPYEPMFEIAETVQRVAEDERQLPGRIRIEIRIIEVTERIWVASVNLCATTGPSDRAAAVTEIYRLHEQRAMFTTLLAQTSSRFRYDHLSFCGIPALAVPSQRPIL